MNSTQALKPNETVKDERMQKFKLWFDRITLGLNIFFIMLLVYLCLASWEGIALAVFHPKEAKQYAKEYYLVRQITNEKASEILQEQSLARIEAVKNSVKPTSTPTPTPTATPTPKK